MEKDLSTRKEITEPYINHADIENLLEFAKTGTDFTGEKYDKKSIAFNLLIANSTEQMLESIKNYILFKKRNNVELDEAADYSAQLNLIFKKAKGLLKRKDADESRKKVNVFINKSNFNRKPVITSQNENSKQFEEFLELEKEWIVFYKKRPNGGLKHKGSTFKYLLLIATNEIYETYNLISLNKLSKLSGIPYKYLRNTLLKGSDFKRNLFANTNLMIEVNDYIDAKGLEAKNKTFKDRIKEIIKETDEAFEAGEI